MIIYVIAGPPGIGKSTNAKNLIPEDIPIIDQDLAGYQYKKRGFADYTDLASFRTNQTIKEHLFSKTSFALELNLGFTSHYEYLQSIIAFDWSNQVYLLLFFTDNLILCIDRAKVRYLSGGHEVKQAIIEEMYANTIPLFEKHKELFANVRLIDVNNLSIIEPDKDIENLPDWIVKNNLTHYLFRRPTI